MPAGYVLKLELLGQIIIQGQTLLNQIEGTHGPTPTPLQQEQAAVNWSERVQQTLDSLGITRAWCTWPTTRLFSRLSLNQTLHGLMILRWRIVDERSDELDEKTKEMVRVATLMLTFGDYVIKHATSGSTGVPVDIFFAMSPLEQEELPAAVAAYQRWAREDPFNGPKWTQSLRQIPEISSAGLQILGVERRFRWSLGWVIITLGWQLAESLGDSISMSDLRCCKFDQAVKSRAGFLESTRIACPSCRRVTQLEVIDETSGTGGLTSVFWHCEPCGLEGFFPVNINPESAWHVRSLREALPNEKIDLQHQGGLLNRNSQPIKILFLGSAPVDAVRLALGREVREIEHSLRESQGGRRFETVQKWAVQPTDLQAVLLHHKPQIIHFSGHGHASGELMFEDNEGGACTVPTVALGRLFSILGAGISCVVLNACYSEAQADAIRAHIPCVIGMRTQIPDKAAIAFSSSFYLGLGHACSVQAAFDLGCVQIELAGIGDGDAPILLCKPGTDPRSVFFCFDKL